MDKKYDFTRTEKEMQAFWEREKVYKYQNGRERKVFSIDTPPPTVSGSLHIGHVFSYTQAEIIARYKRMRGYDVFYPFGFDDNGLPTERLVEREGGLKAGEVTAGEFHRKCMDTVAGYEEAFMAMWKSLGFSVDWSLTYQTISEKSRRISQRSFLELVRNKKAYRKDSPVLWCTECRTSIAQAELDTKDSESVFYYLSFESEGETDPLIIATTRPELLYGCVCIFVNPLDERYKKYIGLFVKVPLYGFKIPVMTDEAVEMEKGTGAVMCATFGDAADMEWFHKYRLCYKKVITEEGRIYTEVPYIGGLKVKDARQEIASKLREQSLVWKEEPITHAVGIHERCKTEIEILPSAQWYIDITSEKENFLKAADEINWYPPYMKERYRTWVQNLKWDWCISRQRYFGVPFPLWYCKKCHKPILAEESQLPVDPREDRPLQPCSCGALPSEVIPEKAVFDTWATSSLTPFINAGFGEEEEHSEIFPMGMRSQAHEIIRTWAFYSIVKSIYHTGQLPWKDIMISGFVLAKPGEKISKSQNNATLSPISLIERHSADAIRYWAANAKLGTDTFFEEEELKISKRFLTKLYNAANFCILHLADYKEEDTKAPSLPLLPVDRWILQRVQEAARQTVKLLESYEIGQARHVIDELFWRDFCDYYIEIVKERLYQPFKHGERERQSGQYAIYHSLLGILKLYAIYTPHMTEYIYQQYYRAFEREESLHQTEWKLEEEDSSMLEFGQRLMAVIGEVRKGKAEKQLSMKEELEEVIITAPAFMAKYFAASEKDIKACTGARKLIIRS